MTITLLQLATATGSGVVHAQSWLAWINQTLDAYEISTAARQAAFLAQIGHESAGLRFVSELWGPTPAQVRYERRFEAAWPPDDDDDRNLLAWRLGNVRPGDGRHFRGHGLIQITGRANHARVRDRLRVRFGAFIVPDFETVSEQLAIPQWASLSAGDYWDEHRCNALADAGDFLGITHAINGGENGLPDRLARLEVAQRALA